MESILPFFYASGAAAARRYLKLVDSINAKPRMPFPLDPRALLFYTSAI
jgi:hypothetical protein